MQCGPIRGEPPSRLACTSRPKGRVTVAAGALSGDSELESEGTADRVAGEIKEKVGDVKDKVEDLVDKAKEALHHKQ